MKRIPWSYPWRSSNSLAPLVLLWLLLLWIGTLPGSVSCSWPCLHFSRSCNCKAVWPENTEWSSAVLSRCFHLFPLPCRAAFPDPLWTSECHSGTRRWLLFGHHRSVLALISWLLSLLSLMGIEYPWSLVFLLFCFLKVRLDIRYENGSSGGKA